MNPVTMRLAAAFCACLVLLSPSLSSAQVIRYFCYIQNECSVIRSLLPSFSEEHPGIKVEVQVVPYQAIRETLPVQLAAGRGPDIASVTDLPGLNHHYLDLTPFIDTEYWEQNFGDVLNWFRRDTADAGIYGLLTQLTLTGAYVNLTLFEQARVELPGRTASWEDWVKATRTVADVTGTPFPMAIDRSGHRIAAPAINFGAEVFGKDGEVELIDAGFESFVAWFAKAMNDGTFVKETWAVGGTTYRDARREFVNAEVVFYFSGSWQVRPFDEAIGDRFDWAVVGSPCGPGGCSGMPGGTGMVGFKHTEHPWAVAQFINFFARKDNYKELISKTNSIPAHRGVASEAIGYPGSSPQALKALRVWIGEAERVSAIASRLQGYPGNRAVFDIAVRRVTQIIVGEMSLEQGLSRIALDLQKLGGERG